MIVAFHLRSVIRIRTRAGKARADRFRPARGQAMPIGRAGIGRCATFCWLRDCKDRARIGHVSRVGVGILIRPLARAPSGHQVMEPA